MKTNAWTVGIFFALLSINVTLFLQLREIRIAIYRTAEQLQYVTIHVGNWPAK